MNPALPQVTHPSILKAIGHPRLVRFLQPFEHDLKACNLVLPQYEPANDEFFCALADILSSPALLPERLRVALFTLEAAVDPQNHDLLEAAIQRRLPCVSLTGPLDRALELWFTDPEELSQFSPPLAPLAAPTCHAEVGRRRKLDEGGPIIESHPAQNGTKFNNGDNAEPPANQLAAPANPASSSPQPASNASHLTFPEVKPWPEPVDGNLLLNALTRMVSLFVVLPKWAAETLALWILHTYAFQWRDVSTYIGIESPEPQCGKTTLLTVLCELAHRALASSNISPPAFFRVIEDMCPTLLIDEADTFLHRNEQLQGILNSGYTRKTAFVLRVGPAAPAANGAVDPENSGAAGVVNRFSCWCPKVISQIGRLPETLADRCILISMQRKTSKEQCERLRSLDAETLKRQCLRFVLDHQQQIATARPALPPSLSDRAADVWEPLLALADLAGTEWSERARQAAIGLSASAQENSPIGSLLFDIFMLFAVGKVDRIFSRTLVDGLNQFVDRPWMELTRGKAITDRWLSLQLRPYGLKPRTMRIGGVQAKGYFQEDCMEPFRRYIPKSEIQAWLAELKPANPPSNGNGDAAQSSNSEPV